MLIDVKGKRALFCRPEYAVERVSYDIPTASALKGMLASVMWHPGMYWDVHSVIVMNEIKHEVFQLNEVSNKCNTRNMEISMRKGEHAHLSAERNRLQRYNRCLADVHYIVDASIKMNMERANEGDSLTKFMSMAIRRLKEGQSYNIPVLGCMPFMAEISYLEKMPEEKSFYTGRQIDFGMMYAKDGSIKKHILTNGFINYGFPDRTDMTMPMERQYGLIEACCDAYPDMRQRGLVPDPVLGIERITFRLDLDKGNAVTYMDQEKRKGVVMPVTKKRLKSNEVCPNFGWNNASYIFGLQKEEKGQEWTEVRHKAFISYHKNLLKNLEGEVAHHILEFLENPVLRSEDIEDSRKMKDLQKGLAIALYVNGKPVWEDPEIQRIWEEECSRENSEGEKGICIITGKEDTIELTHPRIKGLMGGQPTGTTLVAVNVEAAENFGKKQGMVANIGRKSATEYAAVLNLLLSEPNCKCSLGNMTIIAFSTDGDLRYSNAVADWLKGNEPESGLDDRMLIHIAILFPSAARIFVAFDKEMEYGVFTARMTAYYESFNMGSEDKIIPLWMLQKILLGDYFEDDQLMVSVLDSILDDRCMPGAMNVYCRSGLAVRKDDWRLQKLYQILKKDKERKITEEFCEKENIMETEKIELLNDLGRTFALCQQIEKYAENNPRYTIYDKYFTKFCVSPATMLPVMVNDTKRMITKLKAQDRWNRKLSEALSGLFSGNMPVPLHLPPEEHIYVLEGYLKIEKDPEEEN